MTLERIKDSRTLERHNAPGRRRKVLTAPGTPQEGGDESIFDWKRETD